MAADWIKIRADLFTHPRFLRMARTIFLGYKDESPQEDYISDGCVTCGDAHSANVTERASHDVTLSSLVRVWHAVNLHCKVEGQDAVWYGADIHDLDSIAGYLGFGLAMEAAGWAVQRSPNCIVFPNFLEFNEPACLRKQPRSGAERTADWRAKKQTVTPVTNGDARVTKSDDRREEIRLEEIRREEIQNTNTCSEAASQPSEPPVLVFPCVGTVKEWFLFPSKLAEYREAYPGIDVLAECKKALQWCRDNTKNRKTAQGMPKFLGGWLGRNQDRAPTQQKVVKAFVTPPADPRTPEQKAADLAADRKRVEADKAQAATAAELLAKLRGGIGTMPEEKP